MKTKLCFHLGGWLGKTQIYTEKIFLLSLIYSNYLKFYFFSFVKFKVFFIPIAGDVQKNCYYIM